MAAARGELASAASPAPWNSLCLNSIQRGWEQALGVGPVSAELWSQAGREGKVSGQRWDHLAKGFPSSQAAPEEGRTLHTMHPGRATSLLCASFSLLRTTQTGKRGNRELRSGSNIQLDEIIAHLQVIEKENSQQPPSSKEIA